MNVRRRWIGHCVRGCSPACGPARVRRAGWSPSRSTRSRPTSAISRATCSRAGPSGRRASRWPPATTRITSRTMGLEPAFGTSYRQTFPLKGREPDPAASLEIVGPAVALTPALVGRVRHPDGARGRAGRSVGRACLLRLPRPGARAELGRHQGRRPRRQGPPRRGQRAGQPPGRRLRRRGHDLLRPLALQVREGRGARRRRRPDHPRHERRGLRLGRPAGLVGERELLPARPQPPAPLRGLDRRRDGRPASWRPPSSTARPCAPWPRRRTSPPSRSA